jgi:hypothetical protein
MTIPAILLLASLSAPAPASKVSQVSQDWMLSTFSPAGVEVRLDERMLSLFAALNQLGHDAAPLSRAAPLPRRELAPLRSQARASWTLTPALSEAWQKRLDAHPEPLGRFVARAASGEMDGLLAQTWEPAGPAFLEAGFAEARAEQVGLTKGLDAPLAAARSLLRLEPRGKGKGLRVYLNPLDGRGRGYAWEEGGAARVVVGPGRSGKADIALAVAQVLRVEARPLAKRAVGRWRDGALSAEAAQGRPAVSCSGAEDCLAESLGRAVGLKVTGAGRAEVEEQAVLGYPLVPALHAALPALPKAGSADGWLADALSRAPRG